MFGACSRSNSCDKTYIPEITFYHDILPRLQSFSHIYKDGMFVFVLNPNLLAFRMMGLVQQMSNALMFDYVLYYCLIFVNRYR